MEVAGKEKENTDGSFPIEGGPVRMTSRHEESLQVQQAPSGDRVFRTMELGLCPLRPDGSRATGQLQC